MKKVNLSPKELTLKFTAVVVAAMIVISSAAMIEVMINTNLEDGEVTNFANQPFQCRPCDVGSVLAEGREWVHFDNASIGTPAEAHVTVSDTSGITIVADFYGFWRNNITIDETQYDELDMPGATSSQYNGTPMVPCLFEYVEIPHDIDVSIDIIASSSDTDTDYYIRPAPYPSYPIAPGDSSLNNDSQATAAPVIAGSVYSTNAFFPGEITITEGASNTTAMIMRGHRILGLSFYPVQFNPEEHEVEVFSQIVIRINYDIPSQIQPVHPQRYSAQYENLMSSIALNYDSSNLYSHVGEATKPPEPPPGFEPGAEYLIITNETFRFQATRLANWKEQKGTRSRVVIAEEDPTTHKVTVQAVKDIVEHAYNYWYPAPTYVLLMGDVEVIPATYEYQHRGQIGGLDMFYGAGALGYAYIASDLGYFNLEGGGYMPDMIYSRISVDTVDQARIIVDKILYYEQYPPSEASFYNSILSAGYFEDRDYNEEQDSQMAFIYTLEDIRYHLKDMYDIDVKYTCAWQHYESEGYDSPLTNGVYLDNLRFREILPAAGTQYVKESVADITDFEWIMCYYTPPYHIDNQRAAITPSINDGKFLVLYSGHGGSKNMKYLWPIEFSTNDRDLVEGWMSPYYNTSFFSDLTNGNMTPLFVNMACNTGWYDGETDQDVLYLETAEGTNAFAEYANECFAENITRLEGGGAIAVIASSRPAPAKMINYMQKGIVQAFWPGLLDPDIQPMFGMGTALLYSKLYARSQWNNAALCPLWETAECRVERTTFEEFHLFGDPETELWTDEPTQFDVSYPISIGTSNPQRFVVTVKDHISNLPVNFAKVCIQQKDDIPETDDIYQVGYTNARGQVIFDIAPLADPSHVNVTVTKHNYRPHLGSMPVHDSYVRLSLSQNFGIENEEITITFVNYPPIPTPWICLDEYFVVGLEPGTTEYTMSIPPGPTGYMNLWVAVMTGHVDDMDEWSPVSVERVARISVEEGPDPYIYSLYDETTWEDPLLWDNPDIIIKRNGVTVSTMIQNTVHDIEVIVHNRGCDSELPTKVTLSFAPFGGGLSWELIGTYDVFPESGGIDTAYFTFGPTIPQSACLRVDLDHEDELPINTINNIGLESIGVLEMGSPGEKSFMVGNPSNYTDYVYIKVEQQGNHVDIWNATVLGYSSQAIGSKLNETIRLYVDPLVEIGLDEWRLFTAEIYVNGVFYGGMIFNATRRPTSDGLILLLILGGAAVIVGVIVIIRRRK